MNVYLKSVLGLAGLSIAMLGGVAALSYFVDPMCYYRCQSIDISRATMNVYYQAMQTVVANPDAQQIVLGSSRGEVLSPVWLHQVTGLKSLNLSKGGAGLPFKISLLRTALNQGLPLKRVIWIADYFEFSDVSTDMKVRMTPAIRQVIPEFALGSPGSLWLSKLQRLIDHNSFAAATELLRKKQKGFFESLGSGMGVDYQACAADGYPGRTPPDRLSKEVDISYATFKGLLLSPQDESFLSIFEKEIKNLEQRGIEVMILLPPYHPDFMKRFAAAYPEGAAKQHEWAARMQKLASPSVKVVSFIDGLPDDDGTAPNWDDGAHPTCRALMKMLPF